MAIGPFSVGYPVNFVSGGDTTRDAFGKHIQEIEKIYGILNALNADKVSASDVNGSIGNMNTALTNHINSTNPHPNYKPSISWSDLTGTKPNLSDLSGNLPMSRITGNLDASRINNLPSSGDGITDDDINDDGYIKFKNGLIIQWGVDNSGGTWKHSVTFPIAFPTICFSVVVSSYLDDGGSVPKFWGDDGDNSLYINNWSKTGFNAVSDVEDFGGASISYIAIGK